MSDKRIALATAPAWRPEPNDILSGTVENISARTTVQSWGESTYPVVTLDTENGLVKIHAFHEVLKNALAQLYAEGKLDKGDLITVCYLGKVVDDDGATRYHNYVVLAGDDEEPLDSEETARLFAS